VPAPAEHDSEFAGLAGWLMEARDGSQEALGQALEGCRQYLLAVAQHALPADLRGKVGPSDLVQDTLLKAHHEFHRFEGESEPQLLAWLRVILLNNVANCARHFATDKRSIGREIALAKGDSQEGLASEPHAPEPSPSEVFLAQERDEALEHALAKLPDHYRQVVQWHNQENLSFEDIGRRTGQSADAVRKIWVRALRQLRQLLEESHETH
jgi:RNA polymerase sigma-70 factor (ECF subfamily)